MRTVIPNVVHLITASRSMKQKLTELKSTAVVGDFRTAFSVIGRTTRQKMTSNLEDLDKTIIQFHLVDVY